VSCLFQAPENMAFEETVVVTVLLGDGGQTRACQGLLLTSTSSFFELSEQVSSAKTCCLPMPGSCLQKRAVGLVRG